mmetsp:Transcript_5012/g.7484  ORF Transcript_5012/g.7484 Transcript_5012/m.7484 type:complete len:113 (-) Transcript_5012:121-459(-)
MEHWHDVPPKTYNVMRTRLTSHPRREMRKLKKILRKIVPNPYRMMLCVRHSQRTISIRCKTFEMEGKGTFRCIRVFISRISYFDKSRNNISQNVESVQCMYSSLSPTIFTAK